MHQAIKGGLHNNIDTQIRNMGSDSVQFNQSPLSKEKRQMTLLETSLSLNTWPRANVVKQIWFDALVKRFAS